MTHGIYITGTDTGIGKTTASCALLHALCARGLRAVGMKPVASGCERTADGWRNDDALRLLAASDPQPDYALVNPYALPEPTAPELAAADVHVTVEIDPLRVAFDALSAQADIVVVEGVGGWAAPLSVRLDQADLARALGLPVILVVGLRLGCISHARLSARAIERMPSCTTPMFSKIMVTLSPTQPAMLEICQASGSAMATMPTLISPICQSHSAVQPVATMRAALIRLSVMI